MCYVYISCLIQFGQIKTIEIQNTTILYNQFTYDYVKLKIGYFSNRIPVWEGIFTLENLT